MKKWERFIVYPLLIIAIYYSYWAHNRLQSLYRINKNILVPSYEKLQNLKQNSKSGILFQMTDHSKIKHVFLYDYEFEQDIDFHRSDDLPVCKVIWHAWVHNPLPYWVNGHYYIEFNDVNGNLLERFSTKATFPNTTEPREATNIYWMPDEMFRKVDFVKSRIYIDIKK